MANQNAYVKIKVSSAHILRQLETAVASDEGLQLQVTDNGKGFDPEAVGDQGGIGLASMQERVENLRGSLQIVSRPGQGTSIRVVVPLARSV